MAFCVLDSGAYHGLIAGFPNHELDLRQVNEIRTWEKCEQINEIITCREFCSSNRCSTLAPQWNRNWPGKPSKRREKKTQKNMKKPCTASMFSQRSLSEALHCRCTCSCFDVCAAHGCGWRASHRDLERAGHFDPTGCRKRMKPWDTLKEYLTGIP